MLLLPHCNQKLQKNVKYVSIILHFCSNEVKSAETMLKNHINVSSISAKNMIENR